MSSNTDRKVIHSIRTEVDSFGRKKYKLQEVAQEVSEQEDNHNKSVVDTGRHKSMLIGREEGLNIEKYIGKIDTNKKKKATEVFYCDVCSEGFKCDMAYLTHLNSPAHNRKLGMNMKVKNVSLDTVSSKISALINKIQQKEEEEEEKQLVKQIENGNNQVKRTHSYKRPPLPVKEEENHEDEDNDESYSNDENRDDDQNEQKQDVKQEQILKVESEEQQEEVQDEEDSNQLAEMQMMKQMGFTNSFGSKKHKR